MIMKLKTIPTVTINRTKWRTGGCYLDEIFGDTALLTTKGHMCCLGFACKQLMPEIKEKDIQDVGTPEDINFDYKNVTKYRNSKLLLDFVEGTSIGYCDNRIRPHDKLWITDAIRINDNDSITQKMREQMLTDLFLQNGINLVFKGDYTKKQIKAFTEAGIKV